MSNASTVRVGGRELPTLGAALSWAQGVLIREDQKRELAVFDSDGRELAVVTTEGKGVVLTFSSGKGEA